MTLRFKIGSALVLAAATLVSACATTETNYYRTTLAVQEKCCGGLTDPAARNACLGELPRPQDETSPINQETFQCVARHFKCDAATGRATRESAQYQLDCLNDLESTQQARNETPPRAP
jgi:hypothetical protein